MTALLLAWFPTINVNNTLSLRASLFSRHIMHGLCAEGDGNATHLAKCPRDFVEAPRRCSRTGAGSPRCSRASHGTTRPAPRCPAASSSLIRAKNVQVPLHAAPDRKWVAPVHHIFFSIACRINRTNVEKRPNLLLTHGQVL